LERKITGLLYVLFSCISVGYALYLAKALSLILLSNGPKDSHGGEGTALVILSLAVMGEGSDRVVII